MDNFPVKTVLFILQYRKYCIIFVTKSVIKHNKKKVQMKLTKKALELIDNNRTRQLLGVALDVSEMTVRRYIAANDDNLTKAAALQVIRKETGLTDEKIFEQVKSII